MSRMIMERRVSRSQALQEYAKRTNVGHHDFAAYVNPLILRHGLVEKKDVEEKVVEEKVVEEKVVEEKVVKEKEETLFKGVLFFCGFLDLSGFLHKLLHKGEVLTKYLPSEVKKMVDWKELLKFFSNTKSIETRKNICIIMCISCRTGRHDHTVVL